MMIVNLREGTKLADRVYSHLRSAILKGELEPGKRLFEGEIAKQLGVSRSPVREAVSRLEQDGLVHVTALKVCVSEVPRSEIEEVFLVRAALEGMAALLATPKLDDCQLSEMENLCEQMAVSVRQNDHNTISMVGSQFHNIFIAAAGNQKLKDMLGNIKDQIQRFRCVSASQPGRGKESVCEHRIILEAFRARDGEKAERLVRQHVLSAKDTMFRQTNIPF